MHLQLRAVQRAVDRGVHVFRGADFTNGLQRGREILAIVRQHHRPRANLRLTGRGAWVGAELVVEAPLREGLAQFGYFRVAMRFDELRQH